ncbi:MarR family winged helix-turn-helix transcriptional regulator [Nannocystis pusilla]|uniref:MarR family winged helix-turn-helix transcriptional regulator n=1 Tax=Nannocystis pusilla TaxID=889268 RepID=UPI003DA54424
MTKGAVSKLIDRLEDKGLATRSPSEVDLRQQAVALTAAGRALVPRLARLADANDHEFFGHLPPPVRDELLRVLQQLARTHHLTSAPID